MSLSRLLKPGLGPQSIMIHGNLIKLHQMSTVEEHQTRSESLANRTEDLLGLFLISCILNGLKENIRYIVKLLKSNTLSIAFDWARIQRKRSTINLANLATTEITQGQQIPIRYQKRQGSLPYQCRSSLKQRWRSDMTVAWVTIVMKNGRQDISARHNGFTRSMR